MLIAVGSTNNVKVQAVEEVIKNYPVFAAAKLSSHAVSSEISEQPMSLEETILGAKNRAKNAYKACEGCVYAFGIESGLFQAPGTKTGYFEGTICCIFDGSNHFIGLSCGFEIPPHILDCILNKNMNLSESCLHNGVTNDEHLGAGEGFVSILTKGRVNRKEYTKQSIMTALCQIEHPHWYTP
jgi:inosine/xanthosine triphosphatase